MAQVANRNLFATAALSAFIFYALSPTVFAAETSDSQTVFCLSGANQKDLIGAANVLGFVQAKSTPAAIYPRGMRTGSPVSIDQWRKKYTDDFTKACSALAGASALTAGNSDKKESGSPFLAWFLPILVGSALTMIATELQIGRTRRMGMANELRLANATFRHAVSNYGAAWVETIVGGEPETITLDRQRLNLVTALRKVAKRSLPFVDKLIQELEGPNYRQNIREGWVRMSAIERQARVDAIESKLADLEADIEKIAAATDSILPIRLRQWKKSTPISLGTHI